MKILAFTLFSLCLLINPAISQDFAFIEEQAKNLQQVNKAGWEKMPNSFKKRYDKYLTIMNQAGSIRGPELTVLLGADSVQLFDKDLETQYKTTLKTKDYVALLEALNKLAEKSDLPKVMVQFRTEKEGGVVKYLSPYAKASNQKPKEANGLTNTCSASMQRCQYYVWVERGGKKSSEEKLIQVDENTANMNPIFINEFQ